MTIEVTREELFHQVWTRPVYHVAGDYGISNVALKKICRKHGVPVPGRGHWARKAAGKKVEPTPRLTVADVGEPVIIRGSRLPGLPEAVKAAQRRARERERRPENRVAVATAPAELHPAVAATWDALDRAEPSEIGLVAAVSGPGTFHVDVARESVPRSMLFLNALVVAAGERGYRVEEGQNALTFVVDGQPVDFKLLEQVTQTPHVPSEEENLAVRKWESLLRRFSDTKAVLSVAPRPDVPEFDFEPTGRLQVVVNEGWPAIGGLRRVFGDGESRPIEKLINPVLVAVQIWAVASQVLQLHMSAAPPVADTATEGSYFSH